MQLTKSFISVVLAFFCCVFLIACSGSANEETTIKDYMSAVASGNTDKAISMLYFRPQDARNASEKAALEGKLKAMLIEMKEKRFDPQGGLKSIEIDSKEFSEDGKKVVIQFTTIFGNGSKKTDALTLHLIDNVWKIAIK